MNLCVEIVDNNLGLNVVIPAVTFLITKTYFIRQSNFETMLRIGMIVPYIILLTLCLLTELTTLTHLRTTSALLNSTRLMFFTTVVLWTVRFGSAFPIKELRNLQCGALPARLLRPLTVWCNSPCFRHPLVCIWIKQLNCRRMLSNYSYISLKC